MIRHPKVNDTVHCPPDRGESPYIGNIVHVDTVINTNIHGIKYVWCTVSHSNGKRKTIWPSHRLGYTIV